jgi:hypothetical protein
LPKMCQMVIWRSSYKPDEKRVGIIRKKRELLASELLLVSTWQVVRKYSESGQSIESGFGICDWTSTVIGRQKKASRITDKGIREATSWQIPSGSGANHLHSESSL